MIDGASSGAVPVSERAGAYRALFILTAAYALAYIDRQIINLLVDPVKHSLGLTDVQVSLLQGLSFITAYIAFVPIMGRLVDLGHRRNILLAGCSAWCVATALCGMSDSFWELFAARFAVGASEACILPAGWSLIADYFSKARAPRAYSIFMLGPMIGGGLALVAGGAVIASADSLRDTIPVLHSFETWQLAFMMVGLSGLIISLLLLTVKEPPRTATAGNADKDRQYTVRETFGFVWSQRQLYFRFIFGMGMIAVCVLGFPAWMPAFLIRSHGVDSATVGFQFGALVLIAGVSGVLTGPTIAKWLERRGHQDAVVRTAAGSALVLTLCCAVIPLMPTPGTALAAGALAVFCYSLPTGIMAAALQVGTPNRVRGIVASLYTFVLQIMGLGVAPTAIALVTEHVFKDPAMVGWSLGIVCATAAACASWLISSALPHFRQALARAES